MEDLREKLIKKFKLEDIEVCDTFFKRLRGLMFFKPKNIALVLNKETRYKASIHMFFVFFPIDVYWLDSSLNIVEKRRCKPFSMATPKKKAKYIVELKI
ncbi:MAG: DUF192 domain-containing protein [Nanoarchaeota archaeon]